jgi:hypothetical protein
LVIGYKDDAGNGDLKSWKISVPRAKNRAQREF